MKTRVLQLVPLTLFVVPLLPAQAPRDPEAPVPVHRAPPKAGDQTLLTPPGGENQKVYGPRYTSLIDAEAARALSDRFRAAYGQQPTAPRIVIYVNRALIDDAGMRLTGRTEKVYETTTTKEGAAASATTEVSGENTYAAPDDTAKPTLADQQTVREIERLFGRVFRNAGAQLADQKTAAAMAAEQPGARLGASQSVKEREALRQVADIAIEVLISSRDLTVRQVSGDATYSVPDIQATAIRLSDAAILGQAAASDVLGGGAEAGHVARQFGVSDITEATAFGLMEDMLTGK